MIIDCAFVEFHSPVFLQGKNFGTKITVKNHPGMKMFYDARLKLMFMEFKGKLNFFDTFHSAEPVNGKDFTIDSEATKLAKK